MTTSRQQLFYDNKSDHIASMDRWSQMRPSSPTSAQSNKVDKMLVDKRKEE